MTAMYHLSHLIVEDRRRELVAARPPKLGRRAHELVETARLDHEWRSLSGFVTHAVPRSRS
jgi:hypothetical protein